jgi:hypothetical protein
MEELKNHAQWWKPRKWDEGELDRTAIKKALEAGETVAGAHMRQTESLRIR